MATIYLIPINQAVAQTFKVALENASFILTFTWNSVASNWFLMVADASNLPLISSIPLVTGVNLSTQFKFTGISSLYVQNSTNVDALPRFEDLGQSVKLYTVFVI